MTMKKITIIIAALILAVQFTAAGTAVAADASEAQAIVDHAKATFTKFVKDKEFTIFHQHLKKAKGLLILPRVLKAGFFWGGSGGDGVLVVKDEQAGEWSQPAFYTVGAVTFGLQIGAEDAEVIMLAMSQKAIDSLFASSFKFGGDISVAAGPQGVGAKKIVTADFVSFAKAKGLYAGLNFEGSGVHVRDELNKAYYGRDVRPIEIIVHKAVSNPQSSGLISTIRQGMSSL
jgi:lipid-binding SYLF domain-containing protein